MKVTIKDVAERAGVSVATVSRVLNGTANVNVIKRLKVEEAVDELEFKPNFIARSLSKKSSNTIGLIVPSIVNPFFNKIAEAVEKRANDNGYRVILCNSNNDEYKEGQYINSLIQNQVDAFVIISNNKMDKNIRVPVVYLDRYGEDLDSSHPIIRSNHYEGGWLAGRHLIDKGCKKIAYIGKKKHHKEKNERLDGFLDAISKESLEALLVYSEYDYESGRSAAAELFNNNENIDGIFAGNDLIAYAVVRESFERNLKIPEDIQLVGYDDIMFSELITPGLTTIAQPIDNLGKLAVDVIVDMIKDKKHTNKDIVLPVNLIKRDTTKNDEV
jgi:DNA-binding LacI/PurR family transcriptional regulator